LPCGDAGFNGSHDLSAFVIAGGLSVAVCVSASAQFTLIILQALKCRFLCSFLRVCIEFVHVGSSIACGPLRQTQLPNVCRRISVAFHTVGDRRRKFLRGFNSGAYS
jgi:hypothetical protein